MADENPLRQFKATPENLEAVAENWGEDFTSMVFSGYWLGASPDGTIIGMEFQTPQDGGKILRDSFPFECIAAFMANLNCAVNTSIDRMQEMANGKKGN
jgi:hypothetical protein